MTSRPRSHAYRTKRGTFYIRPRSNGGWRTWFQNEALDFHTHPQNCAYEIANGYGEWPSFGSPEGLGIPEELDRWSVV